MISRYFSLRNQIFFSISLLVVVSTLAFYSVNLFFVEKQEEKIRREILLRDFSVIERQLNHALDTSSVLLHPLSEKDAPAALIDNLSLSFSAGIDLYSPYGEHLFKALSPDSGVESSTPLQKSLLERLDTLSGALSQREIRTESEVFYTIYYRLANARKQTIGIVRIAYPSADPIPRASVGDFISNMGYVYLGLLLIGALLAYLISRRLVKPIGVLSRQLDRVSDQTDPSPVQWHDIAELTPLVDSYNRMLGELARSRKELAESEREKAWQQMSRMVAHEIKNPLTPMRLMIQQFEMNFRENDPGQREKVEQLSRILIEQIDALSGIADAFSSFSGFNSTKGTTDLVYAVPLSLGLFHIPFLEYENRAEGPLEAALDKTSFLQLLTNLIKNAQHAVSRIPDPRIRVILSREEDCAVLRIEDNGYGIAEGDMEKIFEPNFSTKTSGMGLGLAIVQRIALSAGGKVTVSSIENKGTVFSVRFPLMKEASEQPRTGFKTEE